MDSLGADETRTRTQWEVFQKSTETGMFTTH